MGKKRLKELTVERAKNLGNIKKTLERMTTFQQEIQPRPAVLSYFEPISVEKEKTYLCVYLDRKNREFCSRWGKGVYCPEFSSPSTVLIGVFNEKYQGTLEEAENLLLQIAINGLQEWTLYDKKVNEEDCWYNTVSQPIIFTYPS